MKIGQAFRKQSLKWRYHIGFSIKQETKKDDKMTAMRKGQALLMLLARKTVNSFLRNLVSNCCWLRIHIIPSYWMEFQNIFSFFLGFHWIPIDCWISVHHIKCKVYTELIKLANFFNKRQRKKEIILLWERERIHFGWCLEIHLTLSWSIDSPTAIGGEDI